MYLFDNFSSSSDLFEDGLCRQKYKRREERKKDVGSERGGNTAKNMIKYKRLRP